MKRTVSGSFFMNMKQMHDRSVLRKMTAAILVMLMIFTLPQTAAVVRAESGVYGVTQLQVDGGSSFSINTLDLSYDNNTYFSIRDVACAFAGTSKAFSVTVGSDAIAITTGTPQAAPEERVRPEGQTRGFNLSMNKLTINGIEAKYYSVRANDSEAPDAYFLPMDLSMILDCTFAKADDAHYSVSTATPFIVDPQMLEFDGYFQSTNTVLAGDATTGEVFYDFRGDEVYPIASTTKLMTYLVIMDAVSAGEMSMSDSVRVPEEAAILSESGDGVIHMTAGQTVTVPDLLKGLLLPSSNESALTLAVHLCGSQDAFVQRMNDKARELSMDTAVFYNSNGLPVYSDNAISAKCQNRMSSRDMFILASHIITTYPEVTEITSLKEAELPSLGTKVKNTNGVLFNMPEVNGLKTGTTDRAGACLVTSLNVEGHDLIVVVLGAENSSERIRKSQIMALYAKEVVLGQAESLAKPGADTSGGPVSAEALINMIVERVR